MMTESDRIYNSYGDYVFPDWANTAGWAVSGLSVLAIPVTALLAAGQAGLGWRTLLQPAPAWGRAERECGGGAAGVELQPVLAAP